MRAGTSGAFRLCRTAVARNGDRPPDDSRLVPFVEAGRKLFNRRIGQIYMSCAQCHDDNWGKKLAGSLIPQAQPTGYPIYRLEWQSLGSLQRPPKPMNMARLRM